MIPIKLRIEGFLSYRKPVELDFTGFDLACISGQNGAGKSALLDAITWALFGRARKRDESIINNHPSVKAAEVTLDFDYENNRYRVQRTNARGKTSSVEFFVLSQVPGQDDRWKPLTERTLRETEKKIEDTLRLDFDTFTNASFFLQGKADQFATARPAERKRILSNILGLEIWESYREAAGIRRRDQEKEVRELDGRLSEIQSELDEGPQRKARLAELEARLGELEAQRQARAKELEQAQRWHASFEEQQKMLATLRSQLEDAQKMYERITRTLEERRAEKESYDQILASSDEIKEAYQQWQETRQELAAMEEVADQFHKHEALRQEPLQVIHAEQARLSQEKEGLETQQSDLEKARTEIERLEKDLYAAQQEIVEAEEKIARRKQLDEEIRQLQVQHADAKAENPRLKEEMEDLRSRLDQLEAAKEPECPVCHQPLSEDHRRELIKKYYQDGEERRDKYYANKDLLDNFQTRLKELGAAFADLKDAETQLRDANRVVDQIQNKMKAFEAQDQTWQKQGAMRLGEITNALAEGAFAPEARARLKGIETELEVLGYDTDAHQRLRQAEQAGRETEEALRKLEQAQATLAPIKREIEGLEAQSVEQQEKIDELTHLHDDSAAKLAAAQAELPDLGEVESALHDIQEKENLLRKEVGGAQQKVSVLATQKARKTALTAEREEKTHLIADLKQLERAFGKDGIPALLIEQALPEIEETTNDLLDRLTNGRMSFHFMTQREYKDASRDDMKETLDMVISDSVGERDYEMFSGGEAFRINFSIRLALSQVLARRAGARLQTLVIDEGFGSQDAQGRQRLVEAINLVRDDFEKILVITHLEELKEAFPNRIEVEKTLEGSQIQVI